MKSIKFRYNGSTFQYSIIEAAMHKDKGEEKSNKSKKFINSLILSRALSLPVLHQLQKKGTIVWSSFQTMFWSKKHVWCLPVLKAHWDILFMYACGKHKRFQSHRAFYVFVQRLQAKFAYGVSILSSSQFILQPQLTLKMTRDLKVVKIESKIKKIFLQ